ncbi:MAG TPA: cytochrome c [Blastocatellia bacterium]|nr:cytochrome c [Blastocatellia bacterium]
MSSTDKLRKEDRRKKEAQGAQSRISLASSTRRGDAASWRFLKLSACVCVTGVMLLAACRRDMQDQPKYKPYREGAGRTQVEGTVARGQLREDALLFTGKTAANGQPGKQSFSDEFPFPVTREVLDRGQERFNITCSVCHGRLGDGEGMVVKRGFRRPPSLHIDRLRTAPAGYFFDVVTNGFGAMPDYASQITPRDRWAIIAYIRALQLSQRAQVSDLAAEDRDRLKGVQ